MGNGSSTGAAEPAALAPTNSDLIAKSTAVWTKKESVPFLMPNTPKAESWSGPICDPLGFTQHGGVCWNDCIQEIFLFSDGFKDKTQGFLYNTPYKSLKEQLKRIRLEDILNGTKLAITKDDLANYLDAFRGRFINHYNYLKTGDERFDVCVMRKEIFGEVKKNISERAVLKRSASVAYSISAARSVLGSDNFKGGNIIIITWLSLALSRILLGRNIILQPLTLSNNTGGHTAFYCMVHIGGRCKIRKHEELQQIGIDGSDFRNIEVLGMINVKNGDGHALAFFVCNGKTYFYDDNFGNYLTDLPATEILHVGAILYDSEKNVIFVKRPFFFHPHDADFENFECMTRTKVVPDMTRFTTDFYPYLTIWKDGAWKTAESSDLTADKQTYDVYYIENKYIFSNYDESTFRIEKCESDMDYAIRYPLKIPPFIPGNNGAAAKEGGRRKTRRNRSNKRRKQTRR